MTQDLYDREALRACAERYAQGADRRDKALWQEVLAPDIVIEGPGFCSNGLTEALATLDTLDELFRATQHRVSTQVVTLAGDQAQGETYCVAEHILKDTDAILVWAIRYQDTWRRTDGVWRFTRRFLIVDWQETRPVSFVES